MWIYLLYILITLAVYYTVLGGSRVYKLESGTIAQKNRKAFSCFAGVLLWAIMALRGVSVGSDTINYFTRYDNIERPEFSLMSVAGQEWGFDMLEYICSSLGMGWQVFLALVSAIIIIPVTELFHKYSANVWMSFFLYLTIGLFSVNMSAMRQSLAVSMVVVAMIAMLEKKYIKFVIFILVGSLFHFSAIFALLMGVVPLVKFKSRRQLAWLLLIPVVARVAGHLFLGGLESLMPVRYLDNFSSDLVMNPILEAVWISILLFSFLSLSINRKVTKDDFQFYFMTVLFVASVELSYSVYLASRLAFYFESAVMVAIPSAILRFRKKDTRTILMLCVFSLCFAFLIISSSGSDTLAIFDYKFFWQ